jgi:predicted Zn finger-like uncharacterized protein
MFKVECPACKAPYQVDERRVPPSGLKMRCPKCGTSFQVEPPPSDPRGTSPVPVLGAALGFGDGRDAASGDPPARADRPPLPRKKPAARGTMIGVAPPMRAAAPPGPAAPDPPPSFEIDLPSPRPPTPTDADPFADLDLPVAVGPKAAARPSTEPFDIDLPSPVAPPLPLRRGLPTRPQGSAVVPPRPAAHRPAPIEADLPTAVPPRGSPAASSKGAADPFGELDLPASAGTAGRPGAGHADLPAVRSPSPGARTLTGHPSLPPSGSDLPTVGTRGAAPHGIDLPSPAFQGADLPSPSFGTDLPSVSRGVGLPEIHGAYGGFGELDLPIVSADLPTVSGAGLPSPAAGLPMNVQAGLPMNAVGLPMHATDDPFGAAPLPDFEGSGATAPLHGGAPDPFGGPSSDPFGGGDPFGAGSADPFATGSSGAFGAPPDARAPDPFGGGDDGGGEFAPSEESSKEARALVRQGGGSTAYGEVNLDDGGTGVAIDGELPRAADAGRDDGDGGEGGEFSDLAQVGPAGPAVGRVRADAASAAGSAVAEIQAKRRRRRVRVAVVTFAVTALTGGALTLLPSVGPFGSYFILDQVRRGEYERRLAAASDAAHRALGSDTYPDADKAMREVADAAAGAARFKPLAAYRAFTGFAKTLRFGAEPEVYARAKVGLEELADSSADKLQLARATKAAVDGEIARARQMLGGLSQKSPRDVDVAVVRGETELKARDPKAALAAWTTAAALERSARTSYGLARAEIALGDAAAARKLADDVLRVNPRHVGARLLIAESVWKTKRDEVLATKLLEEIQKASEYAGPEERIDAQTLFGEIHLNRGRVSQAEKSFDAAIKLAELIKTTAKAARALSGLGEALFRAGRYSQAIARFKAGAQADPDDLVAQVGVAKSSLELERLEEARDMLVKLRKGHPKDMDVAYWYGRAQESLGDRKEAEAAYRDAILAGKDDPEAVHAYIALAGVQSQGGQLDAANATLSDAQKLLPSSPALYKALGRVAMTQGRYGDGLQEFEHALSADVEDVEARFLVGTALVRQHQFDKALEIFDAVAKVDRDFPGLALERGILFQESGRTEEALREYEAALAKAPNDLDLMLKVGCGKAEAGSGTEAEKLLRKVLEQRQTSAETHFCLGRALMGKNVTDALKAFERAVQLDPNHAEYHLYVGRASNEAGNLAKAGAALKKALELDQGLADAYWQRGVLRVRQTRSKDAVEDLTKALALRPSRFEAHADLAFAYNDLGKEDLAIAEWQKAIAAKPSEPTWRFHYGKLLSLRLQNAAAAEQLSKAIELSEAGGGASLAWVPEAHRLAALSLGNSGAAIPHWQAFLKTGAANSPYRNEAKQALRRLGSPWEDD